MTTPFVCILVAFILVYAPKAAVSLAMAKEPGGYDNKTPRVQQAALKGWAQRAQFAHMNGFESFPPFAAAVIVAHLAHADPSKMTWLSLVYVGARVIYPIIFMANLSTLRSTVWTVGFAATVGLFVLPLFG